MRAVVQRVRSASVSVAGVAIGAIDRGLLVFVGVGDRDAAADAQYMAAKVRELRIFADEAGKMNLTVADAGGAVLVVSQFTLYGDCRRGRRPSFASAAPPAIANQLYELMVGALRQSGLTVATGRFQADMDVALVNDGPVTLLLDSHKSF